MLALSAQVSGRKAMHETPIGQEINGEGYEGEAPRYLHGFADGIRLVIPGA